MTISVTQRLAEIPARSEHWPPLAATPIPAIERFFDLLNREGVEYCHWKGNWSLQHGLAGEKDLDLLLDRRSLPKATAVLATLGYKPATVRWEPVTHGVIHYYGLEERSGQLIHIHLYTRVASGESFIPSHVFPWERMLLDHGYAIGNVRVPSKPAELVLFVLRTLVRYGSLLDLVQLVRNPQRVGLELDWLLRGSPAAESLPLVETYCPVIHKQFIMYLKSLSRSGSLVKRLRLARRIRRQLQGYAIRSFPGRIAAYVQLLSGELRCAVMKKKKKVLQSGGAVIAFVGPEASGKSTLVEECRRCLGNELAVRAIHAGKPPATWLTAPLHFSLPLLRRVLPRIRPTRFESSSKFGDCSDRASGRVGLGSVLYAGRAVALAWARRRLLISARRSAANGEIVVCDRYPSDCSGIDSRRLVERPDQRGFLGSIYNLLARLERRIYLQVPPPDIVVKLRVPLEKAKVRNRERVKLDKEDDAYLEKRHEQYHEWKMSGVRCVFEIHTDQPLPETLATVTRLIWSSL
jgi:thymidylate kinase